MQNLNARIGDDFELNLVFQDEGGAEKDITGWDIDFIMRQAQELEAGDEGFYSTAVNLTTPVEGVATLNIADTITDAFEGSYFYDIKTTDDSGIEKIVASGVLTFSKTGVVNIAEFTIRMGATISTTVALNASANVGSAKLEKFSRTAQSGYTTLSANQLAGSAVIETAYAFRTDSLFVLRNGVVLERGTDYTEASDRSGFTLVGTYDDTDKFEARYTKSGSGFISADYVYDKFTGDNSTTLFALSATRKPNTLSVFLDGILKELGVDYTETGSGASITFTTAPGTGVIIEAKYVENI